MDRSSCLRQLLQFRIDARYRLLDRDHRNRVGSASLNSHLVELLRGDRDHRDLLEQAVRQPWLRQLLTGR
jgi:hypothetical protein